MSERMINLYTIAGNKRLASRVLRLSEKEDADGARDFISTYFHSKIMLTVSDRIVIEMIDMLASFVLEARDPEGDLESYFEQTRECMRGLINRYYRRRDETRKKMRALLNRSENKNYMTMTIEERKRTSLSPSRIKELLEQLDTREEYTSYIEGYEYSHFQAYEWLIRILDEALSKRQHRIIERNAV